MIWLQEKDMAAGVNMWLQENSLKVVLCARFLGQYEVGSCMRQLSDPAFLAHILQCLVRP